MNWLPTVDDPKVKGYCCIFSINNNGIVSGHKFGKGQKIPVIGGERQCRSVFMECPSRERSTRVLLQECISFLVNRLAYHEMAIHIVS